MNAIRTPATLVLAIGVAAAISSAAAARQAPPVRAYTLTPVTYGMQLKTPDGRVVFDYMTKKPPTSEVPLTSPSVACFHPVLTPSGERVTALAPDDHPHHRGIYLAWHDAEFRQRRSIPGKVGQYAPALRLEHHERRFLGLGRIRAARQPRDSDHRRQTRRARRATHARIGGPTTRGWSASESCWTKRRSRAVTERDGAFVLDFDVHASRQWSTTF